MDVFGMETPGKECDIASIVETCYATYLTCMNIFINRKLKDNCFFLWSVFWSLQGMNNLFLASFTFVSTTAVTVSCKKPWKCFLNIYQVIKGYKKLSL